MARRKIIVPASFYKVVPERTNTTQAVHLKSGLLRGRRLVPRKMSDKTRVIRMTKFKDVNKNNRRDDSDLYPGQIIGRVSGSDKSPKPKKVEIIRHWRKGNKGARLVRTHVRRIN